MYSLIPQKQPRLAGETFYLVIGTCFIQVYELLVGFIVFPDYSYQSSGGDSNHFLHLTDLVNGIPIN
jgi:hypothetical protein